MHAPMPETDGGGTCLRRLDVSDMSKKAGFDLRTAVRSVRTVRTFGHSDASDTLLEGVQ